MENRAGTYVQQLTGYRAFIPRPLPPTINYSPRLLELLSDADTALARLDAASDLLPNPELFVSMYVRKEALLSSQIEGTQASLADVLAAEAKGRQRARPFGEYFNYVRAMNHGLDTMKSLPVSLRLIREIHKVLLQGTRGGHLDPGEFRTKQNWIGASGCTLNDAKFVPPPPEQVLDHMSGLEKFLHDTAPMPLLIKAALVHCQFETIHPFLDGNGRIGRLLITLLLIWKARLVRPVLYLSYFFKQNRQEYYDRLQAVRETGAFEDWIEFFLRGVAVAAADGAQTARKIQELREKHREQVTSRFQSSAAVGLLDFLFRQPVITVAGATQSLKRSKPVANKLVAQFMEVGILTESSGQKRNRLFRYQPYLDLFGELRP
jgi:Fic family protein